MGIALALLGFGRSAIGAVFSWLSKLSLRDILVIILVSALLIDHLALLMSHRHAHKVEAQLAKSIKLRAADRAAYIKAQHDAAVQNIVQVKQIEQHYQRNNEDARQAYLRDLAELRASKLRKHAADKGSSDPANPPATEPATPRINDAGVCVPATSDVCEAGAEIELRLMHLQDLIEQQSQVDPNK